MKQLNRLQTVVMLAGALMMVVGAGLYVVGVVGFTSVVFAVGALAFASMQLMQTYDGNNFTVRRLRLIMSLGDVFFILSAVFMLEDNYRFLLPLFTQYSDNGYYLYVNYIHNNWVVVLLMAAVIEIYTTHRISYELKKEAKKT